MMKKGGLILVLTSLLALPFIFSPQAASADNSATVDMWWPTNGVHVSGIQPFKGLLENTDPSQYNMFWQVDTGNLIPMNDNSDGYPHKEASVNLAGWTWDGNGPYKITLYAKDKNGNVLAQKSVSIFVDSPAAPMAPTISPTTSNSTAATSTSASSASGTSSAASASSSSNNSASATSTPSTSNTSSATTSAPVSASANSTTTSIPITTVTATSSPATTTTGNAATSTPVTPVSVTASTTPATPTAATSSQALSTSTASTSATNTNNSGTTTTSTTTPVTASSPATTSTVTSTTSSSTSSASTTSSGSSSSTASAAATATTSAATSSPAIAALNIWWPTNGAIVTGSQPFKGTDDGVSTSNYTMYWQVDGGQPVLMTDNSTDYPHKEFDADLSSWNWKGTGPYVLTFTAKDLKGNVIGTAARTIYTGATTTTATSATASATNTNTSTPATTLAIANPLAGKKIYFDSNNSAAQTINSIKSYDASDANLLQKIATQPEAIWLGSWLSDSDTVTTIKNALAAAKSQGAIANFVLYNIPQRDCGSFSAGGANNPAGYQSWINTVTGAIGSNQAITILEPDALADASCLSTSDQATRISLIAGAVKTLKTDSGDYVYIDAGHPNWIASTTMSTLLKQAGIAQADGFSLNVSNYETTADDISYGTDISSQTGGKHFIIDTSRNGNGSDGEWCNANGSALGSNPTTSTGQSLVDAFLWVKHPGESDGNCNGGPSAGTWWTDYAVALAKNTH